MERYDHGSGLLQPNMYGPAFSTSRPTIGNPPAGMEPPVTPARSVNMAKVRGKDTKPEIAVRRAAHALGLRFRLHRHDLPGTPDLIFPKWKTVIFVHGCFWHRHERCAKAGTPKTRTGFWTAKFDRNVARDARNVEALRDAGWNVQTVWECETRNSEKLADQLRGMFKLSTALQKADS